MRYRADIDGLRAIAVTAVVLDHADLPGFSGGFVGVDVFFVISGFLITGLMVEDLGKGTFSFADFYERRARRILPALFAVLVPTLLVGASLLMPQDLTGVARSAIGVLLFASNMVFARSVGYFATAAAERPLLHTWSLAVEEQFYLIFPCIVLPLVRLPPRWRAALVGTLAAASLAGAVLAVPRWPNAAFYLSPFRAWELAVGAFLAVYPGERPSRPTALAGIGLAAVLVPIVAYDPSTPFPGAAALPPVLGTALLVRAGTADNAVSRALGSPAPVYVGRISYSFYLWHFPLLAYARYLGSGRLSLPIGLALAAASFGLAAASLRFVEAPFRDRTRIPRGRLAAVLGVTGAALLAVSVATYAADGVPDRFSGLRGAAVAAREDYDRDRMSCFSTPGVRTSVATGCPIGSGPVRFVLWGDSHAEVLRAGLADAAEAAGLGGVYLGKDACAPLPTLEVEGAPHCVALNEEIARSIEAAPEVETVVLGARWAMWFEGTRFGNEDGAGPRVRRPGEPWSGPADQAERVGAAVEAVVGRLRRAGKRVVLVGPIPEMGAEVPRRAFLDLDDWRDGVRREVFDARTADAVAALGRLEGATVLWPHRALCGAAACRPIGDDGRILYYDDDHLSTIGSRRVVAGIASGLW